MSQLKAITDPSSNLLVTALLKYTNGHIQNASLHRSITSFNLVFIV